MLITSCNCRGLGNPKKSEEVKDLMRMESIDILSLQETEIDKDTLLFLSKTKQNLNNGIVISARGTCGGLDTIWSVDKFTMLSSFASQHWIFLELQCSVSKISIALFDLYLPVNHVEKKECWLSLSNFLDTNSLRNIIVVGDLNIIFDPSEKKEVGQVKTPCWILLSPFCILGIFLITSQRDVVLLGIIIGLGQIASQLVQIAFWCKVPCQIRIFSFLPKFCLRSLQTIIPFPCF